MGAKQGKNKVKWSLKEDDVESDDPFWSEVSLERSTAQDRKQNLIGLPEELIVLIAVHLAREDIKSMAVVAQVCKTWRRISYKDAVWRAIARDRDMELDDEGAECSVRLQVLNGADFPASEDFCFIPPSVKKILLSSSQQSHDNEGENTFQVLVINGYPQGPGQVGKTCFAHRATQGFFCEGRDIQLDYFCKILHTGAKVEVVDSDTKNLDAHLILRERDLWVCEGFIFLDRFDDEHGLEAITSLWALLRQIKDLDYASFTPAVMIVQSQSDLRRPFVRRKEVLEFCAKNEFPFVSCSAKTGVNVDKIISMLYVLMKSKTETKK